MGADPGLQPTHAVRHAAPRFPLPGTGSRGSAYSNRFNNSVPFVPPKPKEFESA